MAALPDGWLIRVSRSKGKVYYYNTRTKQTQWVRPTADAADGGDNAGGADAGVEEEGNEERPAHTRKRPRTEELSVETSNPSAHGVAKSDGCEDGVDDPSSNADANTSKTRAMVAMCMRVGGSTFVARQSSLGPLSSTTASKLRGIFTPWDHQLEAIENIILQIQAQDAEAKTKAHADRFLLQHSTGAGKTMTLAALTYQLLYVVDAGGARFHTVVILIDRVKLDEQVGNTVESFLRRNGIHEVYRAETMSHLAKLMDNPSTVSISCDTAKPPKQRVIITTIHKLGLLIKDEVLLTRMLHRNSQDASGSQFNRIAIITDEAHRSHTASTRDTIQKVMHAGEGSENAHTSFIGFTATPNTEAMHLFGTRSKDGSMLRPFHCYPIAKAAADGRIMDVLQNYTCLRVDVETTIPSDVIDSLREMRVLRAVLDHASDDLAILKAKAALMMQDFTDVKSKSKSAKCMVVARSRRDVLRYYQLISVYVTNRQLKWSIYAAFSGTLTLEEPGNATTVTEDTLNGSQLNLASSDIVIVCDKLDTGYNDPKLSCMYIDRYLRSSSQTVQLASRLNRQHKDKPSVRIIDFANHAAQIRRSFADFWEETRVQENPDDVDLDAEMANAITGHTILCDYFPELWEDPDSVRVAQLVELRILPMERDAFHQVLDALRLFCSAFNNLQSAASDDNFATLFAIRYDTLMQLKKEVEAHSRVSNELSSAVDAEQVKSKMVSRVRKYHTVFSGAISPSSVLLRIPE
uniref:WW domain-containing protein n=1 Tax=Globisporangium ultimum (strain ATCC 200006 / CBS 805.95 / DAOM BR144) TaxID=431595 RepID=K3XC61_GLOUD